MFDDENDGEGLGSAALLKALNDKVNAPAPAPEGSVRRIAEDYAKAKGLKLSEFDNSVKVKPQVSAKVAEAYAQMQHNPNDPKVQRAYQALIKETEDQYKAIQKAGMKISKIEPGMDNPYKNSASLVDDITKNKHMYYYPTEQGFGSGGSNFSDHPLFKDTSIAGPDGKPMKANDLFRVVHDYFGHAKDGNKFGATGEERAYLEHSKMYSPEARKALASETRGQNSWVNYGPVGEQNRKNPGMTTYADQKAGLLPEWATKHVDEIDNPLKYRAKALAKIAGKSALPGIAAASALTAPSMDTAAAELLIPGGVGSAGQSPEEEAQMLAEIDARKRYDEAKRARTQVLRGLAGK